jgi:formate hydrogenlyase subunit 4
MAAGLALVAASFAAAALLSAAILMAAALAAAFFLTTLGDVGRTFGPAGGSRMLDRRALLDALLTAAAATVATIDAGTSIDSVFATASRTAAALAAAAAAATIIGLGGRVVDRAAVLGLPPRGT